MRSTGRETRHSATLFTSSPIWTGQVLNVGLYVTGRWLVLLSLLENWGYISGGDGTVFSSPGRDQIGAHPASYPVGMRGIATEAWSSSLSACAPSRRLGGVLIIFATRLVQILCTLNMSEIILNFRIIATLTPVDFTILAINNSFAQLPFCYVTLCYRSCGRCLNKGFVANLKYFLQLRKHVSMLLLKKKHCNLCYRFIETTLTVALLLFGSICVTKIL